MASTPTAVSAPGKVLLAGGYTVLDPTCRGLVFALSARIHAIAVTTPAGDDSSEGQRGGKITVRSPQFADAVWEYDVTDAKEGKGWYVVQKNSDEASRNSFVETTLRYVLSYLSLPSPPSLAVTILADNDYYSQPQPPIPRFNNLAVPISAANKTGLGSSAALVTSLTAVLLQHLSPSASESTITSEERKYILHNLAQAAHCAAQGKVGSGFDVAAATYGSCQYQRFQPDVLSAVTEADGSEVEFVQKLQNTVNKQWEMVCEHIRVPKQIGLMMGDVKCGSATPGMVKKVLAWRKTHPMAEEVWTELDQANRSLIASVVQLSKGDGKGDLIAAEDELSEIKSKRIPVIRSLIKSMGNLAGVPIEPDSQTKLLDEATRLVPEVIGGVVPGAGGFDAVCFLYVDTEDSKERLGRFLREYELDGGEGFVRPLEAREEEEGVREEKIEGYADVKHYLEAIL